jgi:hypothetical protein
MALRFAVRYLAAVKDHGPVLRAHRAGPAALGAGLLGSQGVRLLLQQDGEGAFGEAGSGGAGDLFHGLEIDGGARPSITEGAASDDLAPLGGEVADGLEVLRGGGTLRHGESFLVLARGNEEAFMGSLYRKAPCPTKLYMASV